jgi:hypothetical protein
VTLLYELRIPRDRSDPIWRMRTETQVHAVDTVFC